MADGQEVNVLTVVVGQLPEHPLVEVVRQHRLALHLQDELQMQVLRVDDRSLQHGQ